jgi:hypothetical protein
VKVRALMVEGITVVSDLFRPDGNCQPGGRDRSTLWLWNAVKRQVALACGLDVAVLTTATAGLANWLAEQRPLGQADAHWASIYQHAPRSVVLERAVVDRLRNRFCIGFEMPPWLIHLLAEIGVPYIDLHIHPVRFMDDLLFAVRASQPETQAMLLATSVAESEVAATAGVREAMCGLISTARFPPNTLLIVGQRRYDSTQIVDGGFFDAIDQVAEIHALCGRYAGIMLKPHPFDQRHSLLEAAATAPCPILGVVDDNVYRLLAMPQISAVLTVNSSVAHEAPYFGKRVHTLAPLPIRTAWRQSVGRDSAGRESVGRGTTLDGCHASLDDVVLTADFWRLVLAPHCAVTAADGVRLAAKPNRIRIGFDSFWNYQQIDTDRVP